MVRKFFFALGVVLLTCSMTAQPPVGNAALLVIDMQDEFTRHTLDKGSASELISSVNTAIATLRPIDVIFVKADIRVLTISLKGIRTGPAAHTDLDERLDRREGDIVLTKHESSALTVEELRVFFRENNIEYLYLTGIFLGQCVSNTAIHANDAGYKVTVLREAVTAKKPGKSEKFLKQLESQGILVKSIADLEGFSGSFL